MRRARWRKRRRRGSPPSMFQDTGARLRSSVCTMTRSGTTTVLSRARTTSSLSIRSSVTIWYWSAGATPLPCCWQRVSRSARSFSFAFQPISIRGSPCGLTPLRVIHSRFIRSPRSCTTGGSKLTPSLLARAAFAAARSHAGRACRLRSKIPPMIFSCRISSMSLRIRDWPVCRAPSPKAGRRLRGDKLRFARLIMKRRLSPRPKRPFA